MERPLLILVADDDGAVRNVLVRSLAREGMQTVGAEDGVQALKAYQAMPEKPDLILTDVAMPNMSGPDFAAAVLANAPEQKVAFVTAYAAEHAVKMLTMGHPVLPKPFTHEQLVSFVRKAMESASVTA